MFILVKYGCVLSSDNKAGTSLTVDAFSDTVGGTTPVSVAEGDMVLEAAINPETSDLFGKLWIVHDGEPWTDLTPDESGTSFVTPGTALIATAEELDYQKGGGVVFLNNGEFVSLNLSQTIAVVESMIAP